MSIETQIGTKIVNTYISRFKNQCITRIYDVTCVDEDGWVNPSCVKIVDKINVPTNNIYKTNDFIAKRHKEILKNYGK